MEGTPVDKLSRLIIFIFLVAFFSTIIIGIRGVLMYVLAAAVVSLMGRPVKELLDRIKIGRFTMPGWLSSLVTILLIIDMLIGVLLLMVPVFTNIASDISKANLDRGPISLTRPLDGINEYLSNSFSFLGSNFRIQDFVIERISSILDFSAVSGFISGVASFLASFGVGIFSVVFISFFFLKDKTLFPNIVAAFVPNKIEKRTMESIKEINSLMSRYFSGLVLEVIGVALINFLTLFLIGKMGIRYSLGLAFMTGMLNVIPYVGPLIGEILGVTMAVIIKYACAGNFGPDVSPLVFAVIILGCLFATQLVDNFFFQPFIYSSSIKAHPLEIFIVLLLAGQFFGILGMFLAIPGYTVLRVIAAKFFTNLKPIRRLIGVPDDGKA